MRRRAIHKLSKNKKEQKVVVFIFLKLATAQDSAPVAEEAAAASENAITPEAPAVKPVAQVSISSTFYAQLLRLWVSKA